MALSYPLALPSVLPRRVSLEQVSVVGVQSSPLSLEQTAYVWSGDCWEGELEWGELDYSNGMDVAGWLAALNGKEGTFLLGDPLGATPRGTWGGTPLLNGAHAAAARTLAVDGFTAAATGKRGDYLQFGTGSSTRLHMVTLDFTASGGGVATIEIWPCLREAQLDNAAIVKTSTKGLWALNTNRRRWNLEDIRINGIVIPIIEARRG